MPYQPATPSMMVATQIDDQSNWNYQNFLSNVITYDSWHSYEFIQENDGGSTMFRVKVDGVQYLEIQNGNPMEFSNCKLYAGNEWHTDNPGSVRNIKLQEL